MRSIITLPRTLRCMILALALLVLIPALAAGFTCASPITSNAAESGKKGALDQLEEVIVKPGKSIIRVKDLGAWLKRLEGQYRYEGYIDLCGNGNAADQRPVMGQADCIGLYAESMEKFPRNLHCVVGVRWPQVQGESGESVMGGESNLSPALVFYGVVSDPAGIQFMQIDNKGMTTHAQGKLTGDTLTTRGSCGMQGSCQTVHGITPEPAARTSPC